MIFVFYNDDYADNCGVGLARFESRDHAAEFIAERMKTAQRPDKINYTVIEGRELSILPKEVATRIELCG